MPQEEYRSLVQETGEVYHCAADVRHYAAEEKEYMTINVGGTVNVLKFAGEAGAEFYHMSTCSVSGEHLRMDDKPCLFTEQDFEIGQDWDKNIYVKSKFLAEKEVFDAIRRGMPAKIFRLGRLVGRAADGVFQKNPDSNAFYLLMRAFAVAGCMPESVKDVPVDLTPVDYAAKAVLTLKGTDADVFHIIQPDPQTAGAIIREIDPSMEIVEDETFSRRLAELSAGPCREQVSVLIDYWNHIRYDSPTIGLSGKATHKMLEQTGFSYEIPSAGILLKSFPLQESWVTEGAVK